MSPLANQSATTPHRPWLGTSWKMNKTLGQAVEYARGLAQWAHTTGVDASVAILPPFTALAQVVSVLQPLSTRVPVQVGAQNMHWEDAGAYTGEISPVMVRDTGASLVEIGHFERRAAFGETDATVNQKVLAALRHSLSIVLCVGEDDATRDFGVVREFLGMQLKIALRGVTAASLGQLIVAYEPGWAIGSSGTSASTEEVADIHRYLRGVLVSLYGAHAAQARIIYGGSVTQQTAPRYATAPEIDGLFVGRAAWEVADFIRIVEAFCAARAQSVDARAGVAECQ
jgi:L-erythrulose 1-phosphate isomerase